MLWSVTYLLFDTVPCYQPYSCWHVEASSCPYWEHHGLLNCHQESNVRNGITAYHYHHGWKTPQASCTVHHVIVNGRSPSPSLAIEATGSRRALWVGSRHVASISWVDCTCWLIFHNWFPGHLRLLSMYPSENTVTQWTSKHTVTQWTIKNTVTQWTSRNTVTQWTSKNTVTQWTSKNKIR